MPLLTQQESLSRISLSFISLFCYHFHLKGSFCPHGMMDHSPLSIFATLLHMCSSLQRLHYLLALWLVQITFSPFSYYFNCISCRFCECATVAADKCAISLLGSMEFCSFGIDYNKSLSVVLWGELIEMVTEREQDTIFLWWSIHLIFHDVEVSFCDFVLGLANHLPLYG